MGRDDSGDLVRHDSRDARLDWADIASVGFHPTGQLHWYIKLAAAPPDPSSRERELLIAYGLVLDTTGDGEADYVVGLDNDAPERNDFHVWVTNLGTGTTEERVGPPYGSPVEFAHPDERRPDDPPRPPTVMFTFLPGSGPADLNGRTVRFYAWASAVRDGNVLATDYSPDTGWMTSVSL